jgi:acetyl-CoA acetyltransferase
VTDLAAADAQGIFIIGAADTDVGSVTHKSIGQLHTDAALGAVADAGLDLNDVDGLIATVPRSAPLVWHGNDVAEYLGISPNFVITIAQGGSSVLMALRQAGAAIREGAANAIMVISCDKLLTGLGRNQAVSGMADSVYREFEVPYGPTVPVDFALMARRHMYEYGTTPEQLAAVAVTMRRNAGLNAKAQKRDPITVQDVLSSRLIATPLHMLDCSLISDGGGAILVTSRDRIDPGRRAIAVLGYGEGHNPAFATHYPDLPSLASCRKSAERAYAMADVSAKDIDVALIYDPFTIAVIAALEDLGFCDKGDGGQFVEEGHIGLEGSIPVNPHGGLLSYAHPGRPGAMLHIVEAVRQLRGEANGRQVPSAELALVSAEGARLGSYATLILGGG